jgi:DNA-binding HxlR family transcriptional regulator
MEKDINKNLTDASVNQINSITDISLSISYTKSNKLITALYMVTDIIDTFEPLRNKLRYLGTEIISDIYSKNLSGTILIRHIDEVMSLLDIASAVNIISVMNCNILKKEFSHLRQDVEGNIDKVRNFNRATNLSEFFAIENIKDTPEKRLIQKDTHNSIGHIYSTRIGVQKGSTLMQALSDRTKLMSNRNNNASEAGGFRSEFDLLKKKRREDISNIIKRNGGGATIKDIKNKIDDGADGLLSYSEKTLQRELVSMVKDGVLDKTGEKRWSKYFLTQD